MARYLGDTHLLTYALSTTTSPVFSEVIVSYRDLDFRGVKRPWLDRPRPLLPAEIAKEASWHKQLFKAFRPMHKVRDFQLVLCADVWDGVRGYTVQTLKQAVAAEEAERGFDGMSPEPLVICSPRGSCQELIELWAGCPGPWVPL